MAVAFWLRQMVIVCWVSAICECADRIRLVGPPAAFRFEAAHDIDTRSIPLRILRLGLRREKFLMRDPAKGRLWMIVFAIAFLVVATLLADRWMQS